MAHPHHGNDFPQTAEIILSLPFILGIVIYLFMMIYTNKQGRKWPIYRAFLWVSGSFLSLIAVAGPLAELYRLSGTYDWSSSAWHVRSAPNGTWCTGDAASTVSARKAST